MSHMRGELEFGLQMLQSRGTFSSQQDTFFECLERQDPDAFAALNLRAAEHSDGRLFTRAMFLCTMVTRFCGVGGPGVQYVNVNRANGGPSDGQEHPDALHTCMPAGTGGGVVCPGAIQARAHRGDSRAAA